MFGNEEYLEMFQVGYKAVLEHIRLPGSYFYRPVHMNSGQSLGTWIDSLGAFFPGLQASVGDFENAFPLYELYYALWKRYESMPERFNFGNKQLNVHNYPLRPEFIESTYFLYQVGFNGAFYSQVVDLL